jgi:hypothetical protein
MEMKVMLERRRSLWDSRRGRKRRRTTPDFSRSFQTNFVSQRRSGGKIQRKDPRRTVHSKGLKLRADTISN